MEGIVEWVKNYSMVFLLMTVMTSMTAKKEYRRYIQFFVEMVLIMTLVGPVLNIMGKSDDFFQKISYDSFWQGLDEVQADREKIEFLNEDYYIGYYEKTIEADLTVMAEDAGYAVLDVDVRMNDRYELEKIELEVAKQTKEHIIVGTIDFLPEDTEIRALKEKIAEYYQLDISDVIITD